MSERKQNRIVLVSDQAIYLRGMRSLLAAMSSFQMVGEGHNGSEALQLCSMIQPEMILLDLKNTPGREIARQICQRWPEMKVVLVVRAQEEDQVRDEPAGVPLYYLPRDVSEEEFKAAMEQVGHDFDHGEGPHGSEQISFSHSIEFEEEESIPASGQFMPRRNQEVMSRELVMAGRIQADILPEEPPTIPGWDIAALLQPARETSGDFYDFIPLTDKKWGMVVADVTDKGMGAALFMALSSTLLRTYAVRFPNLPALTLTQVSERILSDTRGSMFVTAFFGILESHTGRFVYSSAGHPPGIRVSTRRGRQSIEYLRHTGMALGVSDQAQWHQKNTRIEPGDVLVLYTDGITEAESPHHVFFGEDRLVDHILSQGHRSSREILESLMNEVTRFTGSAPRQDDIAVVVIRRQE